MVAAKGCAVGGSKLPVQLGERISNALQMWSELSKMERNLHLTTLYFIFSYVLLYATPLGKRWLAVKCLFLACLLHGLGFGYPKVYYVPPASVKSSIPKRAPMK